MSYDPDDVCPVCGLKYADFRTGFSYHDVFLMLWSYSDDSSTWRYKRRRTVLGKWHQLKQELWGYHLEECNDRYEFERSLAFVPVEVTAACAAVPF